ncbi:endonuclease domain-containing protein [Kaistella sp. BT6-1-3]|uniref:Endonuclease domain-containing protein n=1 Tax=Kaistella yananensis TaxID=2989820 RepID=A0ABT3JJZ4_9FLAO|nr:endonuclease domain-containing protein [Kaistella yananensis]MCW4450800.1 endonuclease domain-containing protein [Kaistella yananensis]
MKPLKPNYDDGMWKGAPKESFDKARDLRRNATAAERLLWERLRNKQLDNYKFRRQHPVSLYIADFYCHQLKLVIELDGEYHLSEQQKQKDSERTAALASNGLYVLRFSNHEVESHIDRVLQVIRDFISDLTVIK